MQYASRLFQLTQRLIRKLTPAIDKILVWWYMIVQNTVCNFVEKWNAYNVLCEIENDNIVFDVEIQNCYFCSLILV